MNTKQTEALKLALEALEQIAAYRPLTFAECSDAEAVMRIAENAIPYLREALAEQPAQPEQCQCPACKVTPHASDCPVHNEPAWPNGPCDCGAQPYPDNFIDALKYDVAKRDSEAQQAYEDAFINGTGVMIGDKRIDPASIYKEPEQEPMAVARVDDLERGGRVRALAMGLSLDAPLYTSPPASKPWVGLTDEEVEEINVSLNGKRDLSRVFARAIEAKLREKNA